MCLDLKLIIIPCGWYSNLVSDIITVRRLLTWFPIIIFDNLTRICLTMFSITVLQTPGCYWEIPNKKKTVTFRLSREPNPGPHCSAVALTRTATTPTRQSTLCVKLPENCKRKTVDHICNLQGPILKVVRTVDYED